MKNTLRALTALLVAALLFGIAGSVLAQEHGMNPADVIETIYEAVEAKDLATAGRYLADDVVLVLKPGPEDGTFVGKDAVLGWFEHLGQVDFTSEISNAEVSGNRFTVTNWVQTNDLPLGPFEMDGAGVVQDGKAKVISMIMTPESMAALGAALKKQANETAVRRYMDELWSQGDLSVVDEVVSEDFVSHWMPPGEGREFLKEAVAGYRAENPGIYFPIEELIVTEDKVFVLNSAWVVPEGAPEGDKGEQVSPPYLAVLSLKGGLITDRWLFVGPEE